MFQVKSRQNERTPSMVNTVVQLMDHAHCMLNT